MAVSAVVSNLLWQDGTSGNKRAVNFDYGQELIKLGQGALLENNILIAQLRVAGYNNGQMYQMFRNVRLEKETT